MTTKDGSSASLPFFFILKMVESNSREFHYHLSFQVFCHSVTYYLENVWNFIVNNFILFCSTYFNFWFSRNSSFFCYSLGDPVFIKSTGPNEAEMLTSQGAIYRTANGGLNWKAQVKETIDATLNRVSSSGTSGASFFNGKVANQVRKHTSPYIPPSVPVTYTFLYIRSSPFSSWIRLQFWSRAWISHFHNHAWRSEMWTGTISQSPPAGIYSSPGALGRSTGSLTTVARPAEFKTWGSSVETSNKVSGCL